MSPHEWRPQDRRKRFGVWVLLPSGQPWMFAKEFTLDEALRTARTLRTGKPYRVWIADPVSIGVKNRRGEARRRD